MKGIITRNTYMQNESAYLFWLKDNGQSYRFPKVGQTLRSKTPGKKYGNLTLSVWKLLPKLFFFFKCRSNFKVKVLR